MNLIELLVQELPKRGGWPEGVAAMAQDTDGDVKHCSDTEDIKIGSYVTGRSCIGGSYSMRMMEVTEDQATAIVTREQYEAALAAAQQPIWDGKGLPPVGCECEVVDPDGVLVYGEGESGEVVAHVENTAVIRMSYGLGCFESRFLRPVRSEAGKKRDEVIESIFDILNDYDFEMVHIRADQKRIANDIVERIASGMIPHIRIE
ncbi:hypothetical protein R2233_000810 [Cronobacter turicensis]|nr:hypothetical protein [Cronobacter turicensis]